MQVQLGGALYTLQEGLPLPIEAGQVLRVFYSFSYRVADTITVPVWASLYTVTPVIGTVNRVDQAQVKGVITLEQAIDWQKYQGQADIAVGSGVKAGVYGLMVELPGFEDMAARVDDCIEIAAAPGVTDWIGPLMMIAVMGMMVQMMAGTGEGIEQNG